MAENCDIVLITALPKFRVVGEFLEFELTSGRHVRPFRIPKDLGWAAVNLCIDALGEAPPPDNVRRFKKRDKPHD